MLWYPGIGRYRHAMVEDTFERYIAGEDPHHIETMFRRVYSAGFTQRPDISMMGVFSGIEIAIWDILGKAHDQPLYQLLGGRFHDRLRTYTYLYPESLSPDGNPGAGAPDVYHDGDAAAARALDYIDMGFTAVKQDPAGPYGFQGGRELSLVELNRCEDNVQNSRGRWRSCRYPFRYAWADDNLVGNPAGAPARALRSTLVRRTLPTRPDGCNRQGCRRHQHPGFYR